MKVFVYGTLRKELGNHYLLQDSVYLGTGLTADKYVMLESSTGHSIPFVVKSNPTIHWFETFIEGELYEVDDATLYSLDRLEGHPGWYKREYIDVVVDGETTKAMIYFMPWSAFKDKNVIYVNTSGDFFSVDMPEPVSINAIV